MLYALGILPYLFIGTVAATNWYHTQGQYCECHCCGISKFGRECSDYRCEHNHTTCDNAPKFNAVMIAIFWLPVLFMVAAIKTGTPKAIKHNEKMRRMGLDTKRMEISNKRLGID